VKGYNSCVAIVTYLWAASFLVDADESLFPVCPFCLYYPRFMLISVISPGFTIIVTYMKTCNAETKS